MSNLKNLKENDTLQINNNQEKLAKDQMKETSQDILALKNAGFLKKLFPNDQYREYSKYHLALIKTELDARRVILSSTRQAQIQIIKKLVSSEARKMGVQIDKEEQTAIIEKILEHESAMNEVTDKFIISYLARKKEINKLDDGPVKDDELKRLESSRKRYFRTMEAFAEEFLKSANFHIKNHFSEIE